MKALILILCGILFSTQSFAKETYHFCERERLDSSGFSSIRAAESWYPKTLSLYANDEGKRGKIRGKFANVVVRDDNKRVTFKQNRTMRGGYKLQYKVIMLANGEVHADLGALGGFKSAGGAVYQCSNWNGNYTFSEAK